MKNVLQFKTKMTKEELTTKIRGKMDWTVKREKIKALTACRMAEKAAKERDAATDKRKTLLCLATQALGFLLDGSDFSKLLEKKALEIVKRKDKNEKALTSLSEKDLWFLLEFQTQALAFNQELLKSLAVLSREYEALLDHWIFQAKKQAAAARHFEQSAKDLAKIVQAVLPKTD